MSVKKVIINHCQVFKGQDVSNFLLEILKLLWDRSFWPVGKLETGSVGGMDSQRSVRKEGAWDLQRSEDICKTRRIQAQIVSEPRQWEFKPCIQKLRSNAVLHQLPHLQTKDIIPTAACGSEMHGTWHRT